MIEKLHQNKKQQFSTSSVLLLFLAWEKNNKVAQKYIKSLYWKLYPRTHILSTINKTAF